MRRPRRLVDLGWLSVRSESPLIGDRVVYLRPLSSPLISVVIPTRGRETRLAFALEALAEQTLSAADYEVVVVRDRDAVGPLAPAPVDLAVRFLRTDSVSGPTLKRNLGWTRSKAPLVAFTDDDCRPSPDWLEALLRKHAQLPDAFLQGRTVVDPDEAHLLHGLARSRIILAPSDWHEASNITYPRALLEQLGGFDESFEFGGEDTDLGLRAMGVGAPRSFVDAAVVRHAVLPRSPLRAVREAGRWTSMPRLFALHPRQRRKIFARIFLKEVHALALLALLGLGWPQRRRLALPAAMPYVLFNLDRSRLRPLQVGRQMLAMPSRFAADLAETAATIRSAVRHRVLLI